MAELRSSYTLIPIMTYTISDPRAAATPTSVTPRHAKPTEPVCRVPRSGGRQGDQGATKRAAGKIPKIP